jgi:hypothetical protein
VCTQRLPEDEAAVELRCRFVGARLKPYGGVLVNDAMGVEAKRYVHESNDRKISGRDCKRDRWPAVGNQQDFHRVLAGLPVPSRRPVEADEVQRPDGVRVIEPVVWELPVDGLLARPLRGAVEHAKRSDAARGRARETREHHRIGA